MRKTLLMTTGLAWLALTGAASATIAVSLEPGPKDPTYFTGQAVGSNTFTVGSDMWSLVGGTANIAVGTTPGVSANPLGMTHPYMAVEGGGTERVVFGSTHNSLSLYWGSIDANEAGTPSGGNLNSFMITIDGYSLSGLDLVSMYGAHGNGSHGDPLANQMVTISGLADFTTVDFTSTRNAFEFSLFPTPVPEPATWAMMALGFAGLGYAAFRRNSKVRALAI